jgi:hypothetical protein
MTEDEREFEGVPDAGDTVDVPEVPAMASMPPAVAAAVARELGKIVMDRKAAQPEAIIDLQSIPLDIMGVVPRYGRWNWYKGWKKDPTDPSKVIYDLYVAPKKISKILAKTLENIDTRWGSEKTKVFVLWTVTKARTYDPNNKRVVPIRQIMMTPLMARRGADVLKLLDKLSPEVIQKSVEYIKRHENLMWADMARQKAEEAETAWAIVERKSAGHFKSTERMLNLAGEATDKGDEEFAKSFTENKDWKEKLADNWCFIILGIIVIIYLLGYAAGWWTGG